MDNQESFANLLAQQDAVSGSLQIGEKVRGKIIAISGDDVFVDIGAKQDGVLDKSELVDARGNEAQVGDEIEAFITGISSQGIKMAKSMSGGGIGALEDAMANGIPVDGRVEGPCKGGYQISIMGKRAFCPASQMDMRAEPSDAAGGALQFLITKIENHGRNIVVSRRALLEREARDNLAALLEKAKPGDILDGTVSRLAPYGAFVEIAPFVEGMVHISELSWSRIDSPEAAVSPGDRIRVKILNIDKDDKNRTRISLSRKQAEADPWTDVEQQFRIGDIIEGKVMRLTPFGAFVEIAPGIEGLAHVSEISWEKRIAHPEDIFTPGQTVAVKIKDIKPEARKISLSVKDAQGDPWLAAENKFAPGTVVEGRVESRSPYGLFVNLAPGVTGLLPAAEIKKSASDVAKLEPGQKGRFVVQKLDSAARRISLKPLDSEISEDVGARSWRDEPAGAAASSGILAQALQKAMQQRKQ